MKPRYAPTDYKACEYKEVNAVIYWAEKNGSFYAMGYSGKRSKHDFHYRFESEEKMDKYTTEYVKRLFDIEKSKIERKEKRLAFVHTLKVGDILSCSWGWEQTNVDFYQVIEVKGKMVKIREIQCSMPNGEEGFMTGFVIPLKDQFTDEKILTKKVLSGNSIKIASYAWANVWDGKPERTSWYG
jgi:hypothetical protein